MDKNKFTVNYNDQYWLIVMMVVIAVSILIHIPELISSAGKGENQIFPDIRFIEIVSEIFFSQISILILFLVNTFVFKFNKATSNIGVREIIFSFVLSWFLSYLLSSLFYYTHILLNIPAVQATVHHYLHPIRDLIITCVVISSCYIIYLVHKQQHINVENQQLRIENIRNQYETLKNQLNPHMLFNSLNTLQALIREAPSKAHDYTQELSNVLRYMLHENVSKNVTLAEELDFIEAYLFLLKMRFADNLSVDIQVDKQYHKYFLPPMSLQLLIENAVKHNEITTQNPLKIELKTTDNCRIYVNNVKQPKITKSSGGGIGLSNLAKRYRLIFGKEIQIADDAYHFCVSIPLIQPNNHESTDN